MNAPHRPAPARTPGRRAARWLLPMGLLLAAIPARADMGNAFTMIGKLETTIVDRVSAIANGSDLHQITMELYLAMGLGLFLVKCAGWALRGFDFADVFETLHQLAVTGFMMGAFMTIVPAMFKGALGVGEAMLAGIAGLQAGTDPTSLPSTMVAMFVNYGSKLAPHCDSGIDPLAALNCLTGATMAIVAAIIMAIVLAVMCILIMVVDIWGFWLYAVALAVGPVLVPFTLYQRLAFLFDGWLKFFIGTLVYIVVSRICLALVAVALFTFMGTSAQEVANGFQAKGMGAVDGLADILGMLLYCAMGIAMLAKVTDFAGAIVGGAGVGGVNFGAITAGLGAAVRNAFKIAATGIKGAKAGKAAALKKKQEKAAAKQAKEGDKGKKASADGKAPKVPGLNFAEALGAGSLGMTKAYLSAAKDAAMKNPNFRQGFNAAQAALHKADKRQAAAERAADQKKIGALAAGFEAKGYDKKAAAELARDLHGVDKQLAEQTKRLVAQGKPQAEIDALAAQATARKAELLKAAELANAGALALKKEGMTKEELVAKMGLHPGVANELAHKLADLKTQQAQFEAMATEKGLSKLVVDAHIQQSQAQQVQAFVDAVKTNAQILGWDEKQAQAYADKVKADMAQGGAEFKLPATPVFFAPESAEARQTKIDELAKGYVDQGFPEKVAQELASARYAAEEGMAKYRQEAASKGIDPMEMAAGLAQAQSECDKLFASAAKDHEAALAQRTIDKLADSLNAQGFERGIADELARKLDFIDRDCAAFAAQPGVGRQEVEEHRQQANKEQAQAVAEAVMSNAEKLGWDGDHARGYADRIERETLKVAGEFHLPSQQVFFSAGTEESRQAKIDELAKGFIADGFPPAAAADLARGWWSVSEREAAFRAEAAAQGREPSEVADYAAKAQEARDRMVEAVARDNRSAIERHEVRTMAEDLVRRGLDPAIAADLARTLVFHDHKSEARIRDMEAKGMPRSQIDAYAAQEHALQAQSFVKALYENAVLKGVWTPDEAKDYATRMHERVMRDPDFRIPSDQAFYAARPEFLDPPAPPAPGPSAGNSGPRSQAGPQPQGQPQAHGDAQSHGNARSQTGAHSQDNANSQDGARSQGNARSQDSAHSRGGATAQATSHTQGSPGSSPPHGAQEQARSPDPEERKSSDNAAPGSSPTWNPDPGASGYRDRLGVGADASQDEIKKAYRYAVKQFHPDVSRLPKAEAEEKFRRVHEAYLKLSDVDEQRAYARRRDDIRRRRGWK